METISNKIIEIKNYIMVLMGDEQAINILLYILLGSVIVLGILSILDFKKRKRNQADEYLTFSTRADIAEEELNKIKKDIKKPQANIDETIKIVQFIDDFMAVKFQYYLTAFIMAYFISDKELDKKEIKKLKEDFYEDISNTLNALQKEQILKVFTKHGITLYVHQSFLRFLNDANIKFKNSGTDMDTMNRKTLQAIYN